MTAPTFATSYSSANTLSECGEQYRLAKIEKVPQLQAVYLMSGSAFHVASEWIDHNWFGDGPDILIDDYIVEAQREFESAFHHEMADAMQVEPDEAKWLVSGISPRQDVRWWLKTGPELVEKYIMWRVWHPNLVLAELPDGTPAIEVPFDQVLVAGQPRRGAIDRVFVDQDSGVEIEVDLKTGSKEPDKHLQHALYKEAWYQLTGRQLHWAAYYMARKGELSQPIDLTPHTLSRLEGVLAMADRAIQAGSFIPKPSTGFPCSNCTVRPYCRFVN